MSSFPPCPLLSLPLEVVFLITRYLNVRYTAFLARTCRAMQALLCPELNQDFEKDFEKLMLWAARNNRPYTLQRAFLIRTAYPGDWSEEKASLLYEAISTHSPDAVRTLLAHLVDPNKLSRGTPLVPLSVAVLEGDIAVVTMLLEAGADPNLDRGFGRSAIELANYHNMFDIMDLLVTYGAELFTDSESSSCGCRHDESDSSSCDSAQDDESDSPSCGSGQDDDSESSSCGSGQDDDSESSSCGSGQDDESGSSSCGSGQDDESDSD